MLLISFHVGCDMPLLSGHTPLVGLAIDGREALVSGVAVRLEEDEHVLPVGVNNSLGLRGSIVCKQPAFSKAPLYCWLSSKCSWAYNY